MTTRKVLVIPDAQHGSMQFTPSERRIIDSPLFQRLRRCQVNDLADTVHNGLHSTRLEHVLGTCDIAGKMAQSLRRSPSWRTYVSRLAHETDLSTVSAFVQLVRYFALLRSLGHPPLSWSFQMPGSSGAAGFRPV